MGRGLIQRLMKINPYVFIIGFFFALFIYLAFLLPYPYNWIIIGIILIILILWGIKWTRDWRLLSKFDLSNQWFKKKYEKFISPIPGKYEFIEELHTETNVDKHIHEFLIDDKFLFEFDKWHGIIERDLTEFKNSLNKLNYGLSDEIEWLSYKSKILKKAEVLKKTLFNIKLIILRSRGFLKYGDFEKCKKISFKELYDNLELVFREYEEILNEFDDSSFNYIGQKENKKETFNKSKELIYKPSEISFRILNNLHIIVNLWNSFDKLDLHILGGAGVGKTDAISFICKKRLEKGLPVLIISGRWFRNNSSIEEQIKKILDIPDSYKWEEFLDAMDTFAKSKHIYLPIIIDGLNETTYNNAFSSLWRNYLGSFIQNLKSRKKHCIDYNLS